MKFHEIKVLTGKLILARSPGITWPTIPFRATSAPKSTATWQLIILWICGLIGQCLAHRAASNRVPLRYKLIFLLIVGGIIIPVLVERLRF